MPNKKTIWIINQYAGSSVHGMEYRHYYLAKEFIAQGHKVVMISGSYSHLHKVEPKIKEDFTNEDIEGITYCWVKIPKYERSVSMGRFKNMMAFAWNLRKFPSSDFPKPDAIVVSSPSLFPIIIARKWATKFNAKLIFEIRDIWPLTLQELNGLKKWHPLSLLLFFFEKYAYAKADKIVSLLPDAYKHIQTYNVPESKLACIPNGIFVDSDSLNENDLMDLSLPKDKFIVGYLGSIGKSNALEYFVQAINKLDNNSKLFFVFVGKGAEKEHLQNSLTNPQVKWVDAVDKKFVPSVLSQFDVCYIGWHKLRLYEMGISANKIFDYMYAAKPIIHSNNASNDLIKSADCGFSIPAEDVNAISDAILESSKLEKDKLAEMGQKGKKYVLENHMYENLAMQYISIM
ncbi:MAG: glycosyltransferase family 4 protein [Bacteroidales bacterium]|nr:glycosyltransferase family 4 protein [Bacteroidales bacterium]